MGIFRVTTGGTDGNQDTYIGDATSLRGISGGQKRRLSLAKRLTSGAQVGREGMGTLSYD